MPRWMVVIIIILLSLDPSTIYAQEPSLHFEQFTPQAGLASGTVYEILQDSQGFMWFGTWNGLNKYDGYQFTTYRHSPTDPTSLTHNTINALYEDASGTLWIGTEGGGLNKFDPVTETFTAYRHDPADPHSLSDDAVQDIIAADDSGTLWLGTYSGLNKFDPVTETFTAYRHDPADPHSLSNDEIYKLYKDRAGRLWLGTYSGLNKFDPLTGTFTRYLANAAEGGTDLSADFSRSIYQDQSGIFWLGTQTGLAKFDPTTETFTSYVDDPAVPLGVSSDAVYDIRADQTGLIWLGTDHGLVKFDPKTEIFTAYTYQPDAPFSLSNDIVYVIYEDRTGILWVGTENGLNKLKPLTTAFIHYQADPAKPDRLSENDVSTIYEDEAGVVWLGTWGGGLNKLDPHTGHVIVYRHDATNPHSLSADKITALQPDRAGQLWVGTEESGLNRFDPLSETFRPYPDPQAIDVDTVNDIYEDEQGLFWLATAEGLNKFDPTKGIFTRYYPAGQTDPDAFANYVEIVQGGKNGVLWLGTDDGLYQFNPTTESFTPYEYTFNDNNSLIVFDIYEAENGVLWIATLGGLNKFDLETKSFSTYTQQDGLENDIIYGILPDQAGNLWLSTESGLSKLNPQTEMFRNYGLDDGLITTKFNSHARYRGREERLFFGSEQGLVAFYPQQFNNPHPPPLALTAFQKFNEDVRLEQSLSQVTEIPLSYQDDIVSFEFAALDYTDPARNRYAYKLEGLDKAWIMVGSDRRFVTYTNLKGGEYTFRVKGSNSDGVWNEAGLAIRLTVTDPPWQTWWAYTLYGLGGVGTVLAYVHYRTQSQTRKLTRQRQINEELQRMDRLKDEYLSQLKESQAVAQANERRFRSLFDNAPLCVFEVDISHTPPQIVEANQRAEQVYGWSGADFRAMPLEKIVPTRAIPEWQLILAKVKLGQTVTLESTHQRRDGTTFPVRVSATPEIKAPAGRIIMTVEDITQEKERQFEAKAINEERRRIAHEIHDGLAQDLAALRFKATLWHDLVESNPAQMHPELDTLLETLGGSIREVRRSIFALRPLALAELGFFPALKQFTKHFGEQYQLQITLTVIGLEERLPITLELPLFRVIQESLNNIGKHAQAHRAEIVLDLTQPHQISLIIQDEGQGFDPAILTQAEAAGHFGLKQMRERIELLNGTLSVQSQVGQGTEVRVELPF